MAVEKLHGSSLLLYSQTQHHVSTHILYLTGIKAVCSGLNTVGVEDWENAVKSHFPIPSHLKGAHIFLFNSPVPPFNTNSLVELGFS